MTATFRLTATRDHARLTVDGELDVQSRGPLAWRLLDLEQLECREVQLDFENVSSVDPCCLRLIAEMRDRVVARGIDCNIVSVSALFRLLCGAGRHPALAVEVERTHGTPKSDSGHEPGAPRADERLTGPNR